MKFTRWNGVYRASDLLSRPIHIYGQTQQRFLSIRQEVFYLSAV